MADTQDPASQAITKVEEPITYVICCPMCRTKLNPELHHRKADTINGEAVKEWYCPFCGHEMDRPVKRGDDFFEKEIGKRIVTKRDPTTKEMYTVEKPMRRKYKKKFDFNQVVSYEDLCKGLEGYLQTNRFRRMYNFYLKRAAFLAFLYLTGSRVSEVTGIKATDEEGHRIQRYLVEPTKISDVKYIVKNGTPFMVVQNMPVLKRRGGLTTAGNELVKSVMRRNVYINIDKEKPLVDIIKLYMIKRSISKNPSPYLFSISRQGAMIYSRHLKLGTSPHLMRHQRATDLIRRYKFNSTKLAYYFGWADEKTAQKYIHLHDDDIIDSLM